MNIETLLSIDYRAESSKKFLQKTLLKIKPLEKYSNYDKVPLEKIEKLLFKLQQKYDVNIALIYTSGKANNDFFVYSGGISKDSANKIICAVHAVEIYELFAKMLIKVWDMKKKGELKKRI